MSLNIGSGSSVSSLNAQHRLLQAGIKKNAALEKLSSGLRINKGSDDPAGLLMSELLRSQISGYDRALRNTQETNNVMSIAEGGLSSVSSLLTNMKSLAIHAMNSGVTTGAQTQADQMEMNSALQSLNRVVSTTNYAGRNLLDGSQAFSFETTDASAMLNAGATSIASRSTGSGDTITVDYAGGAANQAERAYLEADFGGSATATAQELVISGNEGGRTFSFAAGTSVEDMAKQINDSAGSTGVNAYAVRDQGSGATMLRLASAGYGSDQQVRVSQLSGTAFGAEGATAIDKGQDATVAVNGESVTAKGLTASVSGTNLNATINLAAGSASATTVAQTGYDQDTLTDATTAREAEMTNITGGMRLQLGGGAGVQDSENVSIGNFNPAALGQVVQDGQTYSVNDLFGGGAASLANDPALAVRVIDQAIRDVAAGRADIGAYQANSLDTNANNLMVAIENTTATESNIRDADMASAMAMFIKNRLLENAGLKGVQNSFMNANSVARLLGGN